MLEEKIDLLAKAINRLCDQMEGASTPVVEAEPEVKAKPAAKKKAVKKAEPVAEAEPVEPVSIPTMEEAQAYFNEFSQAYDPCYIIAGIKHYGFGRMSEFPEDKRGELVATIKALETALASGEDVQDITPADLYKRVLTTGA